MSIYFSGTLTRSSGIVSSIAKEARKLNLKAVKRISVSFDPFGPDVKSTREFLFILSTAKVAQTNPKCILKTDVVCDRQQPVVKFSLIDTVKEQAQLKEVRFVCDNLNTLELLQLCNKHVSALAPVEEVVTKVVTKSEKQKLKKIRK